MTGRADLPRIRKDLVELAAVDLTKVWDRFQSWTQGPMPGPARGERGGGLVGAEADDRRGEALQRRRAALHASAYARDLETLSRTLEGLLRRCQVALPDLSAKNAVGELDPVTSGDVAAAGWCSSCWRNDQQLVVREKTADGRWRSSSLCGWCRVVRLRYGVEPPLEILRLHHAGRRISEQQMLEAVAKVRAVAQSGRRKRRKAKV